MKVIHFTRTYTGVFKSREKVKNKWADADINVCLCTGPTTRKFDLERGGRRCVAIFTKQQPRTGTPFVKLISRYRPVDLSHHVKDACTEWYNIEVTPFSGSFLGGVQEALCEAWKEGYRYVRIESR